MAVLREVKYLNFQHQKDIPTSAENLFSQYETFRKFVGNLELIVGWYNEVSWCHIGFLFAAFWRGGGVRLGQRCMSPMWSRMEYVSVKVTGASLWVNPCPCLFHLLESPAFLGWRPCHTTRGSPHLHFCRHTPFSFVFIGSVL